MKRKKKNVKIIENLEKKSKKAISLDIKLDILRRYQAGEKAVNIGRLLGFAATTIRTICNRDAKQIKAISEVVTQSQIKNTVIRRSLLLVKMESLLLLWIEHQQQNGMQLNKMLIQEKARNIYNDLQKILPCLSKVVSEQFNASSGWFQRFKLRVNLENFSLNNDRIIETDDIHLSTQNLIDMSHDDDFTSILEIKLFNRDRLEEALKLISDGVQILINDDPNVKQSAKVAQDINNSISCYGKITLPTSPMETYALNFD